MLPRRLLSRPRSLLSSVIPPARAFSASHIPLDRHHFARCPSLADIDPDGAAAFDARQKDFRAKTAAAQRAREQRESQSSAPTASAASSSAVGPATGPLGSRSTAGIEAEEATSAEHPSKPKGALSSLIYGTEAGQEMDRELERSYSQVLARGKYVHSIVFHRVKPAKVDRYVDLVGSWYPRIASQEENRVNLVGSWRTEVGDCDTFGEYVTTAPPPPPSPPPP